MKKNDFFLQRPELFNSLFSQAQVNCIFIMDENGVVRHVNQSFKNTFGYTEADIIGKHTRILFTEEDQKLQRPEMELILVKKQGYAVDQNYTVHKNGSKIWVSGESVWVEDGIRGSCIVKVIQNIHSQKVQEKFLAESNELVEKILTNMEEALLVIDRGLKILKTNKNFYSVFDLVEEPAEGKLIYNLNCTFWNNDGFTAQLKQLISSNNITQEIETEWRIPAGNPRNFKISVKLLEDTPDKDGRILLIINDISKTKALDQQREELIAFVSHELRNPLSNLALTMELLAGASEDNNPADFQEFLNKATFNIKRLKQVINELNESTKAAAGQLTINKTQFMVEDMISEAIDTVSMLYPENPVELQGNTNLTVHADRFRLIQVINNFLTNAAKYSSLDSKIVLNVTTRNADLIIIVTDFGPGIPPDQIPFVFTKYYRGYSTKKIEGLGLGLYLCKQIIQAHEGRVWVESEEGKGSSFYFSIPLTT